MAVGRPACEPRQQRQPPHPWHLPLQDKRVADEQEKAVNADAIKIGKEAEEANAIAQQAGDP